MAEVTTQPKSSEGKGWMEPPPKMSGVPDGLEYLNEIDQLLIHQQIELFQELTTIETINRYAVKNTLGQQVYYAYEESEYWNRVCCRAERGFIMHIVDNLGKEVIRMDRPFKCWAGCCWCANNVDLCAYVANIEAPPGNVIGQVRQAQSFWKPYYEIVDAGGNVVLRLRGPCCACQGVCCRADVEFAVLSLDGVTEVGKISKQWGGVVRELLTEADNFGVSFPKDLDVRVKALMIGAAFLIDYAFFEVQG